MMTVKKIFSELKTIPVTTSWYLTEISEAKGRQQLYTKQSPQKLKSLKEHALIESAVSSNRIEGVEVDNKRVGTVIFGKSLLHDRSEEEVRGYRNALELIHDSGTKLSVTQDNIKKLHALTRGEIWDAGKYQEKDSDIIEKHRNGKTTVRFKTVPAQETTSYMRQLVGGWKDCLKTPNVSPLLAIAAFNLDFLCIHPFRDGNGRVSRLLLLLQCYHLGIEVGRFISLERIIEHNKERYYETLKLSSAGWHEGKHDPWHYINYICFVLRSAYREFEERLEKLSQPRGEKTVMIHDAIRGYAGMFSVADILRKCPGISVDLVRKTLKDMQTEKIIECTGRGRDAKWQKIKLGNKN